MSMAQEWILAVRTKDGLRFFAQRIGPNIIYPWLKEPARAAHLGRGEALEMQNAWREKMAQPILLLQHTVAPPVRCPRCQRDLPPESFRVHQRGYADRCLECEWEIRNAKRRQANPKPRIRGARGRFEAPICSSLGAKSVH